MFPLGLAVMSMPWRRRLSWIPWAAIARMPPFFGQLQLIGGKRAGEAAVQPLCPDPDEVPLPGFYPDEAVFREPIARHYGCIEYVDAEVSKIFRQLEKYGLRERTVVFTGGPASVPAIVPGVSPDGAGPSIVGFAGGPASVPAIVPGMSPDGAGPSIWGCAGGPTSVSAI